MQSVMTTMTAMKDSAVIIAVVQEQSVEVFVLVLMMTELSVALGPAKMTMTALLTFMSALMMVTAFQDQILASSRLLKIS